MKKALLLAAICAVALSCKKESINEPSDTRSVTFNVYGMTVSQESINAPRRLTTEDKPMTNLIIFEGTTELYNGNSMTPTIQLRIGLHTLTFIATYQSNPTFVNGIWQADKIQDTFGYTYQINTDDIEGVQNIELTRVNYECAWKSLDVISATGYKATLTFGNYRSTLLAGLVGGTAETKVFEKVALTQGKTLSLTASSYCAAFGVEETITTTLTIFDASDNIVASFSKDVPVLSDRRTVISGKMLGSESPMNVSVNYNWKEQVDVAL